MLTCGIYISVTSYLVGDLESQSFEGRECVSAGGHGGAPGLRIQVVVRLESSSKMFCYVLLLLKAA